MEVEESEFLPVGTVFLGNVDILEVEFVCRDVDLDVFAALELKMLSFRKFDSKLLDEGCNVVIGDDLAFELLHGECALCNLNLEVVLDLDLASETPAFLDLLAVEESYLGRKNLSAAFKYLHLALAAVGLSAAGRREENLFLCEGSHKVASRSDVEFLLSVVDIDLDSSLRGDFGLHEKEKSHEDDGHDDNHHYS